MSDAMTFDGAEFLATGLPDLLASSLLPTWDTEPLVLEVMVPGHPSLGCVLEVEGSRVTPRGGADVRPSVVLAIQLPELQALADGTLDAEEAVGLGRIRALGEPAEISRLTDRLGLAPSAADPSGSEVLP